MADRASTSSARPGGDASGFRVTPEAASRTEYDVCVVGSGVAGSLIAKELARAGRRVLVIEAGTADDLTVGDYERSVERFHGAAVKDSNAPYQANPNAPSPRGWETRKLRPGEPDAGGYIVQNGPFELDSSYTRVLGGTTRHWEGKALRLLPDDFETRSRFGRGLDWPVSYDELEPHYARAEGELGVSGNVEDQDYGGLRFAPGYVYPMRRMPPSHLDRTFAREVDGTEVRLGEESFALRVRSTPQARNGEPNPDYDGGRGYVPTGAVSVHQAEMGGRCQGNTNCVPICPVQAKYDARKTLFAAIRTGRIDLLPQTVACRVRVDGATGRVSEVEFKSYHAPGSPAHVAGSVRARAFVIAANAVETARLMLASGLPSSSGLMGRNLMDHAYLLTWALMPRPVGAMRGPLCTSGLEDLRTGAFRRRQAAFRVGIHNDGWGWATGGAPVDLDWAVDRMNAVGKGLRRALIDRVSRQILLACMIEVPPEETNRVTVDDRWTDALGNPRPVVSYAVPPYVMEAAAFARGLCSRLYQRLGAEEHTAYDPAKPGYVVHEGVGYEIRGGNHWAGTHVMGTSPSRSVVDPHQRSWDHPNLFLAGAGSMPSVGTANTTLTLAALCLRTAEAVAADLGGPAAEVRTTTGEVA